MGRAAATLRIIYIFIWLVTTLVLFYSNAGVNGMDLHMYAGQGVIPGRIMDHAHEGKATEFH
jgi:hypothetical protein